MWLLERLPEYWFHAAVLIGAVGVLLTELPLLSYLKVIRIISVVILCFGVYMEGVLLVVNQAKLEKAKLEVKIAQLETEAGKVTHEIEIRYIDRVKVIYEKAKENERLVTIYVPTSVDRACTVNNGFVVLHDAAAAGKEVPATPGATNEEASGIRLSEVETTVIGNYAKYHEVAARLEELQNWVIEQQALYNK